MMKPDSNLQPRRLVAPRRPGPIIDSKIDESHDVPVKQGAHGSGTLVKNMMTLTTVNYESTSVTRPSVSDTPTKEVMFMSINVHRGQPGFSCDCRRNNVDDLPCLKCRGGNMVLDGPKKVQFALGNNARYGAIVATIMRPLDMIKTKLQVYNPPDVLGNKGLRIGRCLHCISLEDHAHIFLLETYT